MLRAPRSLMAPVDSAVMADAVAASPLSVKYGRPVDRDSAYERLAARLAPPPRAPEPPHEAELPNPWPEIPEPEPAPRRRRTATPPEDDVVGTVLGSAAFRSFARSAASALGRELTRGIFGNRRRRR
jgi:hypothetical protein